jgi:hypothetical protein
MVRQGRSASLILPGERHLRAGRELDGRIWIQVDNQARVMVPPAKAVLYAVELLKLCGVQLAVDRVNEEVADLEHHA